MFQRQEIKEICCAYGIDATNIGDVIDTSHGDGDIRYNYIIDNEYVLKMNTAPMVNETFLQNINRLVERYRWIGVWCPKVIATLQGNYVYEFLGRAVIGQKEDTREKGELCYKCYLEEYAPYKIAERCETDEFTFKKKMVGHLGKLAAKYTNMDLVEHKSMWSIIDLAPLDVNVDEKQENADELCGFLREKGFEALAEELMRVNAASRQVIKQYFAELPRCVYQGDLNFSNLLMDEEEEFQGLIDFNMYGTEVNINCFLNETMCLEEKDFEELSAAEIHQKMRKDQEELLAEIFQYYTLNETEKMCFEAYRTIAELFQYPHVMMWKYLMHEGKHRDKVIELLRIMMSA